MVRKGQPTKRYQLPTAEEMERSKKDIIKENMDRDGLTYEHQPSQTRPNSDDDASEEVCR